MVATSSHPMDNAFMFSLIESCKLKRPAARRTTPAPELKKE